MHGGSDAEGTRTICPYCGVGCGLIARKTIDGEVRIVPDPEHPSNYGRLCSKGAALGETLSIDGRLLHPEIGAERVSWEEALEAVANGFSRIIAQHGPDAVAFYVSGQLLTEDYYVANKFMKGFIGCANIDTNSRLCMSSAVVGHKRAFGADTVPGCYDDLEQADLVVLCGSNAAWCHPVLYQRIMKAREDRGMRIVVIDPRKTATAEGADLHLPLAPGTDTVLWNGLLNYLRDNGHADFAFLDRHCSGFGAALDAAQCSAPTIPAVATICRLDEADVAEFYRLFAATERVVSAYSQGVNQSSAGSDKVNAITNCHLLTGRIGRPGAGPLSLTGQPNAMGGREVGGLATTLAAHLDLAEPHHRELVAGFWSAPRIASRPGYKAVDLFDAVAQGRVKAVWIMATNPVVSLPNADRVVEALQRCDLVVVSDCTRRTDTTRYADILLPALTWGEKDGTVTNSERRISRQRAFLPPPGEARPDWWIVSEVAKRMGYAEAFDYEGPRAIFDEHARLSALDNDGRRDFDLGGLIGLDRVGYDTLSPTQWPVNKDYPEGRARLFADGQFFTPDRKARLVPIVPRAPVNLPSEDYPLVLNTGRVRDHWHTMTRTAKSPRLSLHTAEPYIEVHPYDAEAQGLRDGALAEVGSRWGTMLGRVRVCENVKPGQIFAPMHWNGQFARRARIGAVVNPVVDPVSGEPEFKHTPIRVVPFPAAWFGFVIAARPATHIDADYVTVIPGRGSYRYEIAGTETISDWTAWFRTLLANAIVNDGEWLEYLDTAGGAYRAAYLDAGRLEACIFVARTPSLPPRDWLLSLFGRNSLTELERRHLLAARAPDRTMDSGKIVCACFNVSEAAIKTLVRSGGASDVDGIGRELKAGTNCGSCIPELRQLLTVACRD